MANKDTQRKKEWNSQHYGRIQAYIDAELVEAFKAKCKEKGVSQAETIKQALIKFVEEE